MVFLTVILFLLTFGNTAFAEFQPSDISTPYIVLMDSSTGSVIYEKGSHDRAFPASTTKVMTCILALESGKDLNELVNVGENIEISGSLMNFIPNEKLRLVDLIYGMMLVSGNDAAKAIALHIAGSESEFASMMNAKAAELGMNDTVFVKPNGLHDDNHYSTAYDMALLTKYAMQNSQFREIVSTKTYQVPPTNKDSDGYFLENTNKLIYCAPEKASFLYSSATGVKTGSTPKAGRCLIASAKQGDTEFILVLLGDYADKVSEDYRFESAKKLFDWAFDSTEGITAGELGLESTITRQVSNASFNDSQNGNLVININLDSVSLKADSDTINAIKSDPSLLSSTITLTDETLAAPIYEGQALGSASYSYNGKILFTAELTASRTVADINSSVGSEPGGTGPIVIKQTDSGSNSGWLFWVLLVLLIIIAYLALRIFAKRKRRRKRKAYRVRRR